MFQTVSDFYASRPDLGRSFKLHVGCGSKYRQGWCNIDAYPEVESDTHRGTLPVAPDIWADIMNLPAEDESVDTIFSQHVVEHFYRHSAIRLFQEFWRALRPGGVVITEMPDLSRILLLLRLLPVLPQYPRSMGANRDMIKAQLYGAAWEANDAGYPYHKYVWERREFCEVLKGLGYRILLQTGATLSHVPFRDMAVICQKPERAGNEASNSSVHDAILQYGTHRQRLKRQISSFARLVGAGFSGPV